ncbi:hypothetical protein GCM10027589_02390 [Actinocorallia lasiicapitis]
MPPPEAGDPCGDQGELLWGRIPARRHEELQPGVEVRGWVGAELPGDRQDVPAEVGEHRAAVGVVGAGYGTGVVGFAVVLGGAEQIGMPQVHPVAGGRRRNLAGRPGKPGVEEHAPDQGFSR